MILGDYFHIVILSTLKATQVSKAAGINYLSGRFLKDEEKFLSRPISDLRNLSVTTKK